MPLAHTNVFSLASSGTPRCNNNLGASRKSANSSVMADGVIRGKASSQRNSSRLRLAPPSFQQIANFRANFQEKKKTKQMGAGCVLELMLRRSSFEKDCTQRYRIERSIKNKPTNKKQINKKKDRCCETHRANKTSHQSESSKQQQKCLFISTPQLLVTGGVIFQFYLLLTFLKKKSSKPFAKTLTEMQEPN